MARQAQGDDAAAMAAMAQSDRAAEDNTVGPFTRARNAAVNVLFAIRRGDITTASRWGERLAQYGHTMPFYHGTVLPRLLIALGNKPAAAAQLAPLSEKMERAGAHGLLVEVRLYEAIAADTPAEALGFLEKALESGKQKGYIRTFVDEGTLLRPLLHMALSQGVTPEYTTKLLSIIAAEERRQKATGGKVASLAGYPELLSGRELEIMRLVADGLSNQQIADRLIISLNTAKRHVHNVAGKLNATSRTAIVARAREMGLI